VIEHERLRLEARDELGSHRQMMVINQDVVAETELLQHRDAAAEGRPEQKPIVGLALHDVANADELRMRCHLFELRTHGVALQIDPADDTGNRGMRLRQRQQKPRFLERLPRLHRDTGVESGTRHLGPRVLGHEIAAQRLHRVVDPLVLGGVVPPEVLVSVDFHLLLGMGPTPTP
jgi:hypothetical protein